MNLPCCNPCVTCPPGTGGIIPDPNDPANPFLNLSSATPDRDIFYGNWFPNPNGPPLGSSFTAVGCVGTCSSTISQQDANDCAQRQQVLCVSTGTPTPHPNPNAGQPGPPGFPPQPPTIPTSPPVFANTQQECVFECPDGTPFTYTIAAGTFLGLSQAAADAMAHIAACNRVIASAICLTPMTNSGCCRGEACDSSIGISSGHTGIVVALVSGSLPPGLSMSATDSLISFNGTPTTNGTYTFTIRVLDDQGNHMDKAYTLYVREISTTDIPDGTLGTPYIFTLTQSGAHGTVTWSSEFGLLPDGLVLNPSNGQISGTPTTVAGYGFQIRMTDSVGSCTKLFSMSIEPLACTVDTASPLPEAQRTIAYSQQLSSTPVASSWSIIAGSLPTGLSMSSGGLISGTTTTVENSTFTVRATGDGFQCDKQFTLHAGPAPDEMDWRNLHWNVPTITAVNTASASFTPNNANSEQCSLSCFASDPAPSASASAAAVNTAQFVSGTPLQGLCNMRVQWTTATNSGAGSPSCQIHVEADGNPIADFDSPAPNSGGTTDIPFLLSGETNISVIISQGDAHSDNISHRNESVVMVVTFSNV